MLILMQSRDRFAELAWFDSETGEVLFDSRRRNPGLAVLPIGGSYVCVDGRLVCLYRDDEDTLHVRVGDEDVAVTPEVEARFRRGTEHVLELVRRGETLLAWSYSPPVVDPPLEEDPTPGVDEEDHDMGLFVYRVLSDPRRRERVLRSGGRSSRPAPARSLPYARTNAEAHLYMDLHPCACGESDFERDSAVFERGDDLETVYEGPCARCGARRRFEFVIAESLPPHRGAAVVYGGDEPSRIICPAEFLTVSDERASRVPGSSARVDSDDPAALGRVRRDLAVAIAALEEVLKFIPPGADRVPAGAVRSAAGKELYARAPERFTRLHLQAVLDAYRAYAARLPG